MRGLLYSSLLRNRGFIIGTAVYSVIAAVVGVVLIYLSRSYSDIASVLMFLLPVFPLISVVLALEGVDRELENSLKTRFANYALSAVTPRQFIMTELLKNFCFSAYGIVMGMLMLAFYALIDCGRSPRYRVTIQALSHGGDTHRTGSVGHAAARHKVQECRKGWHGGRTDNRIRNGAADKSYPGKNGRRLPNRHQIAYNSRSNCGISPDGCADLRTVLCAACKKS